MIGLWICVFGLIDIVRFDTMVWQDYAITIIVYIFLVVTLPQLIDVIKGKTTLNLFTCCATALGNYGMSYVFFTLDLWLSATSAFLGGSIWLLMFLFSIRNRKMS
jgi:hypothetical protein